MCLLSIWTKSLYYKMKELVDILTAAGLLGVTIDGRLSELSRFWEVTNTLVL